MMMVLVTACALTAIGFGMGWYVRGAYTRSYMRRAMASRRLSARREARDLCARAKSWSEPIPPSA